ncbi:hypothetical protein LVB77_12580 [Lysobacter sp. 5GHs7-4]|uniref:DUF7822 domain-containing protein n=1 Tax=Lysobacter sp. 5GHs7-4 TaxID=2904253 RepID=UPI001E5365F8|nr:hypothetical protein [Lysobacter sp. 5GHs7-4]UHQ21518.1 hypothetical protein LVB77_12580 [Lysobacter sp. 5GHs7-4]
MANRSYLYSSDDLPGSLAWSEKKVLHGVSEYNYDIPLVFKILLTGNPTACRSSIWETPEKIAITGDYLRGRENFIRYLDRISDPAARPLIDEALQFLNSPAHSRKHFILECGEIFDLTEGSLAAKNSALLAEIQEIGEDIDSLPIPQSASTQRGILSKLFRRNAPDPLSPYYEIGLGLWSDILYFDFSENEG